MVRNQKANKSENRNKHRILIFAGGFILWLVIAVLLSHNFAMKGRGPMSWNEILHDWWLFIIFAIIVGVEFVIIAENHIQEKKRSKVQRAEER